LGGTRDLSADVRVIAATNRKLDEALAAKALRQDLYFRLNVFPVEIPPLRERREDILPLARLFVAQFGRCFRRRIPALNLEAESRLLEYPWPGNVRELRNVLERALILVGDEGVVGTDLLPPELGGRSGEEAATVEPTGALAQMEARLIREALAACGGNQSRAAAQLGIGRDALRRRMRRLGLTAS
jgi:transcriptional regulator with PAS, ATPase and Fis domain